MNVMNAGEYGREYLVSIEKVVEVGSREVAAGVAGAVGFNGIKVATVVLMGEADLSTVCEESGASGITGGDNTVEHIHSPFHAFENVLWESHPHEISRFVLRQVWGSELHDLFQEFQSFTDTDAANCIAREIHFNKFCGTPGPEILKYASLYDREKSLIFSGLCIFALFGPPDGFAS